MKKIFTIIAVALAAIMPMQAQLNQGAQSIDMNKVSQKMSQLPAQSSNEEFCVENLVGEYTAYAESAFTGQMDESWSFTITADETDANKVWLQPICWLRIMDLSVVEPIYATIEGNKLVIPMGQCVYEDDTYRMLLAKTDGYTAPDTVGNLEAEIQILTSGLVITIDGLFGVGNIKEGEDGWYYNGYIYTTFTKSIPEFYVYGTDKKSYTTVKGLDINFQNIDGKMYMTTFDTLPADDLTGTYSAYGTAGRQGYKDEQWDLEIYHDQEDSTKVWFSLLFDLGLAKKYPIDPVYAIYDKEAGKLTMPLGQMMYSNNVPIDVVTATIDNAAQPVYTGEIVMNVQTDGHDRYISCNTPIGAVDTLHLQDGWVWQLLKKVEYKREWGAMIALEDIDRISRVISEERSFFENGQYQWGGQYSTDGENFENFNYSFSLAQKATNVDVSEYLGDNVTSATQWSLNGLLGFFSETTETAMPVYTFTENINGNDHEIMISLDVDNDTVYNAAIAGKINFDGVEYDAYLGELDESGNLYTNWTFVVDNGVGYWGSTGFPAIFVFYEGKASISCVMNNLTINKNGEFAATGVQVFDKPMAIDGKIGGVKSIDTIAPSFLKK